MPTDRPRTPDRRKSIAMASLAAFIIIVVAGKITPSSPPHIEADPVVQPDQITYTPVVDTHLTGLLADWHLASATFVRFEPGTATPWHSHSRSYLGLLVTGVMKYPFAADKQPSTIGPGTYWYVPSKAEHLTACVSRVPCLAYLRYVEPEGQR